MTFSRRKLTFLVAAVGVVLAIAVPIGVRFQPDSLESEYPDAPFQKVAADFPRIIPVQERPDPLDKEAGERYREEQNRIWRYISDEGAAKKSSPEEREALAAVYDRKYVRGRELAEQVLRANPQSVAAMFARASALDSGEANPPKALYQFRVLRHLLDRRGRENPADADSREWYLRVLHYEYYVLTSLDRDREALRVVELLEQIYEPIPQMKTWPLLRLKRFDEAEAAIVATERTGRWTRTVKNDRGALEFQRRRRGPCYDAFEQLAAAEPTEPLWWSNFGEAALMDFRFDKAELAYVNSVNAGVPKFRGTAYTYLARLFVQQSRYGEAVDALKKGQSHRAVREPSDWQYDQGEVDLVLTRLLLAVGEIKQAERLARRAFDRPDRAGSSTQTGIERTLATHLTLWSVLQVRLAQYRENDLTTTFAARAVDDRRKALEFEAWTLERKLTKLLDDKTLVDLFRPYLAGRDGVEPWVLMGLIRALPPGVATAAVERTRSAEDHPDAMPYFDAFASEAALASGRFEEAANLARAALDKLPIEAEKLLRARLQAIAAESAFRSGRGNECVKLLDPVLDTSPVVLRLLDIALPVQIDDDGSPPARRLAEQLARSPRLRPDPAGLRILIKRVEEKLVFEMFRVNNARQFEGAESIDSDDEQAAVAAAYRRFHEQLMSPLVYLSQLALNGLDGSPVAVREQNAMTAIMDVLKPKQ